MNNTINMLKTRQRIWLVMAGLVICVLFNAMPADGCAQVQRLRVIDGNLRQFGEFAFEPEPVESVNPESGAALKTDPDLEASLETAERFKNDGNYRIATQLWQVVLQRSGDALYSGDGLTYFSLVQQVEQILAELPAEGLAAYRVVADAEAKEILAEANDPNDITALNKVVRQYFVSSLGDDAAFQLGCIYLDRFDFIGARRMFEKITKYYPDPTVPIDQVLLRIALCQSYLNEIESAQDTLNKAADLAGVTNQLTQIRTSLGRLTNQKPASIINENWEMPLGNARRYGVMPAVPDDMMKSDLVAIWQYYYEPGDHYDWNDGKGKILAGADASNDETKGTRTSTEERMVKSWKEKAWRPAGHLLLQDGRIYFKSAADLSVWSTEKVAQMIATPTPELHVADAIQWRSMWRNDFEVDAATQMIQTIRRSWGGVNRGGQPGESVAPETNAEVQLFGDEIQQQMSIYNGVLYSLEGEHFDERNRSTPQRISPQWNASFRRTRTNFLTAYDAVTGETRWTLPKQPSDSESANQNQDQIEVDDSPWLESGGFMSAPIGYGELILVPINTGGSISICALDPNQNGKTIWKSFLCDEPESGAEPWSAINLTLEGSDLFVNSGMGVVFVLDPATGMVRFAKRYARAGTPDEFRRRSGWTVNRLNFTGWSNDVILPYGRQMICFSSDTNTIEAIDRNTGDLIWRSEMSPIGYKVDYLLGVHEDTLYAAGRETIIAYDLKGEGRMIWGADQLFDGKQSMGRGMLTPNGVYIPVEDSIYQFGLPGENGQAKLLSRVQVNFGTDAPVGNLYSDGQRFWVHGANRLYTLAPKSN